jgi:hypothetical protein
VADVGILLRVLHSAFRPIDNQMIEVSVRDQEVNPSGEGSYKIWSSDREGTFISGSLNVPHSRYPSTV